MLELSKPIQVIVVVPPAFPPTKNNLLFLLLALRHRTQQLLQLILRDLSPQLSRPGQHDEPVLDIRSPRLLDQPYAAQTIGSFRHEDLGEDGFAGFFFGDLSMMYCLELGGSSVMYLLVA